MKKIISVALSAVLALSLIACSNAAAPAETQPAAQETKAAEETKAEVAATEEKTEEKTKKEPKDMNIGYTTENISMVFQRLCADEFEKYANEIGLNYKHLDSQGDATKQVSILDTFLLEEVDGVVVVSVQGAESALKQFNDAGIPIVCMEKIPSLPDDMKDLEYYMITTDEYQVGYAWATYLADVLPENGTVCYLVGKFGVESQMQRYWGFLEKIAELRPDVQVIDTQQSMADTAIAMERTEDWIQRFGADGIDAIVSGSGTAGMGIAETLTSQGLQDEIILCVPDLLTCANIESGAVDCDLFQDAELYAHTAIDAITKLVNGEEVDHFLVMEPILVTKDNYEQFKEIRP